MTGTFVKKSGDVSVYALDGSTEELAEYKAAQGEYYKESDGKPLYFIKGNHGQTVNLRRGRASDLWYPR